jgi:hypothetical protein
MVAFLLARDVAILIMPTPCKSGRNMRILVAEFQHETHTFAPARAAYDELRTRRDVSVNCLRRRCHRVDGFVRSTTGPNGFAGNAAVAEMQSCPFPKRRYLLEEPTPIQRLHGIENALASSLSSATTSRRSAAAATSSGSLSFCSAMPLRRALIP